MKHMSECHEEQNWHDIDIIRLKTRVFIETRRIRAKKCQILPDFAKILREVAAAASGDRLKLQ